MREEKKQAAIDQLFKIQQSFRKPLATLSGIRQNVMDVRLAIEKGNQSPEQILEDKKEFGNCLPSLAEAMRQLELASLHLNNFICNSLVLLEAESEEE